jgi:hypothetical protein
VPHIPVLPLGEDAPALEDGETLNVKWTVSPGAMETYLQWLVKNCRFQGVGLDKCIAE